MGIKMNRLIQVIDKEIDEESAVDEIVNSSLYHAANGTLRNMSMAAMGFIS